MFASLFIVLYYLVVFHFEGTNQVVLHYIDRTLHGIKLKYPAKTASACMMQSPLEEQIPVMPSNSA